MAPRLLLNWVLLVLQFEVGAPVLNKKLRYVETGFAPRSQVALMFVHAMKSGGTSVRFAMHHLNHEWTHVGANFCFRRVRDMPLLHDERFLAANPRLYFEFHCNPFTALAPGSDLWHARAYLMRRGWRVLTAIMLREPLALVPSYYHHFGPGNAHRSLEAKVGARFADFGRAHFDFVLCSIWGMAELCDQPLITRPHTRTLTAARNETRASADADALATAEVATMSICPVDARGLARAREEYGSLPPRYELVGAGVLSNGCPAPLRTAFDDFARTFLAQRRQLTNGCGLRGSGEPQPALAELAYLHCEREPYRALVEVQASWARFQAAVRAARPQLCAQQTEALHVRLRQLDVVGICERWDESFLLIAQQLGVRRFPRVMVNVKQLSHTQQQAQDGQAAELARSEACATSLYTHWRARLAERVAAADGEYTHTLAMLHTGGNGNVARVIARSNQRTGRGSRARNATEVALAKAARREQRTERLRLARQGQGQEGHLEVGERRLGTSWPRG
jgi:hypothetical protein